MNSQELIKNHKSLAKKSLTSSIDSTDRFAKLKSNPMTF